VANQWILDIFKAQEAQSGGVVRRSVADVANSGLKQDLIDEVKSRGFHLIETGDQYVILCHSGEIKLYC